MNIYRLNLKMRMIMEAHDIINREYNLLYTAILKQFRT